MENRKFSNEKEKNLFDKIKNDFVPMSKIYGNRNNSDDSHSEENSEDEEIEDQYIDELSQNTSPKKKNQKKDDTQLNSKIEEIIDTTIVSNRKNVNNSEEEEKEDENTFNAKKKSSNSKKNKIVIKNDYQRQINDNEINEEESEPQSIKNDYENNLIIDLTNNIPSYNLASNIKKNFNFSEEGSEYSQPHQRKNSFTENIDELKRKKNMATVRFSKNKKNEDSYLQLLENSEISNANFQKLKNSISSDSEIDNLYSMITEIKYNFQEFDIANDEEINNISPLLPLDYLVHSMRSSTKFQTINEINKKKEFLKKI